MSTWLFWGVRSLLYMTRTRRIVAWKDEECDSGTCVAKKLSEAREGTKSHRSIRGERHCRRQIHDPWFFALQ